ncbi:hypothetical protein Val02_45480 [Virgisporangium aliadipatigenens]|uniref:Uncharacterized protein n=1 Tax=Virgisporangium aliadipatigenens TaxID=741659 RepID=A0A8J3YNM0_9ACTN|nr:hypothetical protein [Virgisporangium aliadipatigenens]GIJ47662.1 hypothetical protein Val02_45480 [Virgisporangium aliadipatigenens]
MATRRPVVSVRAETGRWVLRVFDVPTDSDVVYTADLGPAGAGSERLRVVAKACLVGQGFRGLDEWCRMGETSWYGLAY